MKLIKMVHEHGDFERFFVQKKPETMTKLHDLLICMQSDYTLISGPCIGIFLVCHVTKFKPLMFNISS